MVSRTSFVHTDAVPKLWEGTIDAHRSAVRDATLDTIAALVAENGLSSVTMSRIAEQTGIGRATLYKYFPDVESILLAWHERHVSSHLGDLAATVARADTASGRLQDVLHAYALIAHQRDGSELAALLHRSAHAVRAEQQLTDFIRDLLKEAAEAGAVRHDVAAEELAIYCLSALAAASRLRSKAAVRRLVAVTLGGLRPPT